MIDRTDLAARLRERAGRAGVLANDGTPVLYGDADAALDREAADALRPAMAIAMREGRDTNWPAFRECLRASLEASHAAMAALDYIPKAASSEVTASKGAGKDDAFRAALLTYLIEQCSYSYGGSSASEPSPAEFGIAWSWQQSTSDVPRMIDELAEDALRFFRRHLDEADPDADPTEWEREVARHIKSLDGSAT